MSLPAVASHRRIAFIMLFIGLIGAGIFGFTQLGLSLTPDISFPMVTVTCEMAGASPEEIDNLVTDVLEKAVSGVGGVQEINSTSSTGVSMVSVEFDYGDDIDQAETDVRRNVEDYQGMLPDEAEDPRIFVMDPSAMPVITMSITSGSLDAQALRKFIEDDVDPIINRADGVGSTAVSGGRVRQILIEPDPAKLADSGISLVQIAAAFSGRTNDVPMGELSGNGIRTGLSFEMSYGSVKEIGETVVGYREGNPVLLTHIADVTDGLEEVSEIVRVNGEEGIILSVTKRSEANTVDVCEAVLDAAREVEELYGDKLDITIVTNQSEYINDSITNLSNTGIVAFIAAVAVLLLFLRSGKTSSLVGVSIPVSLVITFFAMYASGVDLNMLSLAGLAIAVGMLVDNSIVVIESIHRHRAMGESPLNAAVKGTGEVVAAITSSTLTTLMVFIPVLFVPGFTGQLFKDMALTICFSLVASLLVASTLVPAISTFLRDLGGERRIPVLDKPGTVFSGILKKTLGWSLDHRKQTLMIAAGLFLVSLLLVGTIPQTLMPDMDQGEISLSYTLARGTDLAANDSIAGVMEQKIRSIIPEEYIESFYVKAGSGSGPFSVSSSNRGSMSITLNDVSERHAGTSEYSVRILEALNSMAGVDVSISQKGPFSTGNAVEVIISGNDVETLETFSIEVAAVLEGVPGSSSVTTSAEQRIPKYSFVPDYTALSLQGISPVDISTQMQIGFRGRTVAAFTEDGEEYDVFLRYASENRREADDVRYSTYDGYPVEALGSLEPGSSMEQITRQNQTRMVTVSCGTAPGYTSGQVGSAAEEALDALLAPSGVMLTMGGDYGDTSETFMYLLIAVVAAVLLVYMVMAGQFESLREPFIIIFTFPLAFIGVVASLLISGVDMSIMALVGVLLLAGISVNNGIVLIDYANKLRDKGRSVREAIEESVSVRTRPIMMTSLTTIFAMVPVAMGLGEGAEMWQPLGVTVIGGLITTTLLTLIVEPCLYLIAAKK
jgi:HAE1 family hydrophobic/amphiphilic exporter-1